MNETNNNANAKFLNEINREAGALMGQEIPASGLSPDIRRGQRDALRQGVQLNRKAIVWAAVLGVFVLLVGSALAAYFISLKHGRSTLTEHLELERVEFTLPEEAELVASGDGDLVNWRGMTYRKKDSIVNILCLGVDKKGLEAKSSESTLYGDGGQADTIFLAVLDTETGELKLLNISRDTMANVDVYNMDGEYAETRSAQICTAFAYGDGGETSCLNMAKAVSGLMYGVPIDAYASVKLPAVNILNDAVGGVEVKVLEDLSAWDSSLTEGSTVLLTGNQARTYIQARNHTEASANSLRMARQRQYLTAFLKKAFSQIRSDWSVALRLYQEVQDYTCTSLRLSQALYLASLAAGVDFSLNNIITVPGEVVMGEEYAEYYVDENALFQIIMDTYYEPVS